VAAGWPQQVWREHLDGQPASSSGCVANQPPAKQIDRQLTNSAT
jgi:hypothetical protein